MSSQSRENAVDDSECFSVACGGTVNLCPPNPSCGICRETSTKVQCDPGRVTLGELVEGILGDEGKDGGTRRRDVSVYEDERALSDQE